MSGTRGVLYMARARISYRYDKRLKLVEVKSGNLTFLVLSDYFIECTDIKVDDEHRTGEEFIDFEHFKSLLKGRLQ